MSKPLKHMIAKTPGGLEIPQPYVCTCVIPTLKASEVERRKGDYAGGVRTRQRCANKIYSFAV